MVSKLVRPLKPMPTMGHKVRIAYAYVSTAKKSVFKLFNEDKTYIFLIAWVLLNA